MSLPLAFAVVPDRVLGPPGPAADLGLQVGDIGLHMC